MKKGKAKRKTGAKALDVAVVGGKSRLHPKPLHRWPLPEHDEAGIAGSLAEMDGGEWVEVPLSKVKEPFEPPEPLPNHDDPFPGPRDVRSKDDTVFQSPEARTVTLLTSEEARELSPAVARIIIDLRKRIAVLEDEVGITEYLPSAIIDPPAKGSIPVDQEEDRSIYEASRRGEAKGRPAFIRNIAKRRLSAAAKKMGYEIVKVKKVKKDHAIPKMA